MSLLKRIEKYKLFQKKNKIKYKELTNIKKLRYNTKVAQKSGVKIFVKEIPIAKKYSITNTKNVYNIPTKYNYGLGSYGINPFRELKLCQITTEFVLSNKCTNFPLLYGYEIIKQNNKFENPKAKFNKNKYINKMLKDRNNAKYNLILYLEYFDFSLDYEIIDFLNESSKILDFLNKNGILHMDAHDGNILYDKKSKQFYITDFGISVYNKFDLENKDIKFIHKNKNYDKNYLAYTVLYKIIDYYKINEKIKSFGKQIKYLFTNIYKIVKHKKHKKLIQYLIKNKRNINKIRKIFNIIYF